MSRYSEQFKRDGVALYENNEDLSLNAASAKLDINRASLHSWVTKYGTGKRARIKAVHNKAQATTDFERIRQLEKTTRGCAKNAIFCARLLSILLKADSRELRFQCGYDYRTEYSAHTYV
ncbi:transposase [Corynebacterium macginleyi]|uniref:transposase n=1 Tax=Corynebacterium macginleyi TaxID=38290 RepID=UPI001909F996|nr:transposase [Corynebacterium macginleyi]